MSVCEEHQDMRREIREIYVALLGPLDGSRPGLVAQVDHLTRTQKGVWDVLRPILAAMIGGVLTAIGFKLT